MRRAPCLAWLLSLPGMAAAGPAVAPIAVRSPAVVPDGAQAAFEVGAEEVAGASALPPGPKPLSPERRGAIAEALAQLKAGERAFLRVKLEAAARALERSQELLLEQPMALPEAEPAVRGALLLAQVYLARRKPRAADRILRRALRRVPGFPGGTTTPPPPDVAERIGRLRPGLASELPVTLVVETEPAGAQVRVNGAAVGLSPVRIIHLPAATIRVRIDAAGEAPQSRLVDLSVHARRGGEQRLRIRLGAAGARERLARAVAAGDRAAAMAEALALQQALRAESTCLALVTPDNTLVIVRLDPRSGALRGYQGRAPARTRDWRALGRYCGPSAPTNTPPAALEALLWPPRPAVGEGRASGARAVWGWSAVAGGAVIAAVGGWFGLEALSDADTYNQRGGQPFADAAHVNALRADLSFLAGAALGGAGAYLLLTPPAAPDIGKTP